LKIEKKLEIINERSKDVSKSHGIFRRVVPETKTVHKKRCNIARQLIIGKGANPKCLILRLVLVPESFHDQKT